MKWKLFFALVVIAALCVAVMWLFQSGEKEAVSPSPSVTNRPGTPSAVARPPAPGLLIPTARDIAEAQAEQAARQEEVERLLREFPNDYFDPVRASPKNMRADANWDKQ